MAAFPSQHPITQPQNRMDDPFSGGQQIGIVYPNLNDFLTITQLTKYQSKLKKLKCAETEDLKSMSATVGFLHVEEQRIRRYLDHFNRGVLKNAEEKPQPITLANFFKISKLEKAEKSIRKYGVVEFDDLQYIAYSDRAAMLNSNKIEINRFARYCHKVLNSPDIGQIETESEILSSNLRTFIEDAKLKSYKNTLQKLGVIEADDLKSVNRSDMPKMKQVEWDRFTRYREKHCNDDASRRISLTSTGPQAGSPTSQTAPPVNYTNPQTSMQPPNSPPGVYPSQQQPIQQPNAPPCMYPNQQPMQQPMQQPNVPPSIYPNQQPMQQQNAPTGVYPYKRPIPPPNAPNNAYPNQRPPMQPQNSINQDVNVNQPVININLPHMQMPHMQMPQPPSQDMPPQLPPRGTPLPHLGMHPTNSNPYQQTHQGTIQRSQTWQPGHHAPANGMSTLNYSSSFNQGMYPGGESNQPPYNPFQALPPPPYSQNPQKM